MTLHADPSGQSGKLVLVTGASGFIGKELCAALLSSGYRVRALLRNSSSAQGIPEQVEVCRYELDDQEGLGLACADIDLVFHLAGIAHVASNDTELIRQVNVQGTENLLVAARESGAARFVFFSSILAARFDSPEQDTKEGNPYAHSKHEAEQLVLANQTEDFKAVVLRPTNVYGAGMKGNIAGLIKRIKNATLPPLPSLHNSLSMVSTKDLCGAAILVVQDPAAIGQVYAVSDGEQYTPVGLEASIYKALGRNKPDWHCPRVVFFTASIVAQILNTIGIWNNDLGLRTYRNLVSNNVASCKKISKELGFRPTRNFTDELPEIISAL